MAAAISSTEDGLKNIAASAAVSRRAGVSGQATGSSAAMASTSGMYKLSDIEGKIRASAYLNSVVIIGLGRGPKI